MVLDILEDTTITMAATTTMAGVVLISIHRITTINLILGATATALALATALVATDPAVATATTPTPEDGEQQHLYLCTNDLTTCVLTMSDNS